MRMLDGEVVIQLGDGDEAEIARRSRGRASLCKIFRVQIHHEILLLAESACSTSDIRNPLCQTPHGDSCPYRFDQSERPCALQKVIDRAEQTGTSESQNISMAAVLQRVANQHRRDCKQTKKRKRVHAEWSPIRRYAFKRFRQMNSE